MAEIKKVWSGFLSSLMLDVDDAMRRQQGDDSPTNRRGLVRALIAAAEGLAWIYRSHIIGIADEVGALSEIERAALSESAFMVDEAGRISEQRRFLSMVASIRLTSRIVAKFVPDAGPDFSSVGWADLKATIALRNRITHPKREADLEISKTDINRGMSAFHWFVETTITVMEKSNAAFRGHVDGLSDILQLLRSGDSEIMQLYRKLSG